MDRRNWTPCQSFAGSVSMCGGEAREAGGCCLFADGDDFCLARGEMGGDGEQQRTGSGDDYALARDGQAAAHHGVESACTHHVGQRPAREGKESFARAGGQDQRAAAYFCMVVDFGVCVGRRCSAGAFRTHQVWFRAVEDAPSLEADDGRSVEARLPFAGGTGQMCAASPDLAAGRRIVID